MDVTRNAPLILRFGRQYLQQNARRSWPKRSTLRPYLDRSFAVSTRRRAAPEPEPQGQNSKDGTSAAGSADTSQTAEARPRRSLRTYIWATAFICIGVLGNGVMRAIAFPPPLPEPGSEEDEYVMSRYRADLNNLPIVTELRKDRTTWREYDPYSQREAYVSETSQEVDAVESHMTAGAMRGSRGLAIQRSFYNASERREITVAFFGGGISGWPGVTHGGALAAVLKESVERAANGPAFASKEAAAFGESGSPPPSRGPGILKKRLDCESLTLTYKKPTRANNFYVIRAEVTDEPTSPGSVSVKANIEDALTGRTTVSAVATCSPSTVTGKALQAAESQAGSIWGSFTGLFGGSSSTSQS